jgi:hypothetical protein
LTVGISILKPEFFYLELTDILNMIDDAFLYMTMLIVLGKFISRITSDENLAGRILRANALERLYMIHEVV